MKKKSWVKAGQEWVDLNSKEVEFLNIEEDVWGDDLVSFSYKGKNYKSHCVISYSPPN
jgi:hypothetical protein